MTLYVRAVLGVIAAFVLTYAVLGVVKVYSIDPARRDRDFELQRPLLEQAAAAIGQAPSEELAIAEVKRRLGESFNIERLGKSAQSGWFLRSDEMYGFQAIDGERDLVFGPFPHVDPDDPLMRLIAMGAPVVFAALIAFVIVAPLIRRLRALERVTRELARGELGARTEVQGRDAVASLAEHFNHMASVIEGLIESKKQLLQAVSHEFRTPTARIRFELEMLEEADSPEELQQRVRGIDENLVELDELVEELLAYTRLEPDAPELPMQQVDAGATLRAIIEGLEHLRPGLDLQVHCRGKVTVWANERYFRRALQNLITNAARHAESAVQVTLAGDDEGVTIEVLDDGPGIPMEHRERIFEPFTRLDESRSRGWGGAGLGLAIVKRICQWHRAEVRVGDAPRGTLLVTRWPRPS